MALIDVFNNRAFAATEITAILQNTPYRPEFFGQFGDSLFPVKRTRTRNIAVVKKQGVMSLVPVSPIGAPPVELEAAGADVRSFITRRLAKGSTLYAEELQGVLGYPDLEIVGTVAGEIATRALQIREDIETTHEHMRLGSVLGKVVDADGVRVLDDWFANWGIAEPTPFNLQLNVSTTQLRLMASRIIDATFEASRGSWVQGVTRVHALCAPDLFDLIVNHPMIERTYLNYAAAAELRGQQADDFDFGGIVWHKYRPTPGGEFSIPSGSARFFPVGARDAFQRVAAPGEFEPFINQPGQDIIGIQIPDRDRAAWTRTEAYAYPLYVCLRPEMLQRAVAF
jgi:hypothetical protein